MNRTHTSRRAHTPAPNAQPTQGADPATLDLGRLEGHLLQLRQQGNTPALRAALAAVARRAGPEVAQQLAHKVEAAAPQGAGRGNQSLPPGLQRPEADAAAPQGAGQGVRGIPAELLRPQAEPPFEGVGAEVRGLPDALRRPEAEAAAPQGAGQGNQGLPPGLQRPEARSGRQGTPIKVDVHKRGAEQMNDHSARGSRQGTPIKVDVHKPAPDSHCEPGLDPHRDANTVKDRADEAVGAAPRQQASGRSVGGQGAAETIKNAAGAANKGARGAGKAAGATNRTGGANAEAGDKGARASGKGAGAATRTGAGAAATQGGAAASEAAASATATTSAAVGADEQGEQGEDGGLVERIKQGLEVVFGAENAELVNGARTALSLINLIPGPAGLLAGLADRVLESGQNFSAFAAIEGNDSASFKTQQAFLGATLGIRALTGISQTVLDQCTSIMELVQDAAVGSELGAPLTALTLPINEFLNVSISAVDLIAVAEDTAILVLIERIRTNQAPDDAAALDTLEDTFTASVLGDGLSLVFDVAGLVSAGILQNGLLKSGTTGVRRITQIVDGAEEVLPDIADVVQRITLKNVLKTAGGSPSTWAETVTKIIGIWDADHLADETIPGQLIQQGAGLASELAGPSPGLAAGSLGASAQVPGWLRWSQGGLQRLKQGHAAGGAAVDWAVETVNGLVEEGNATIGELLGSKDPMGQLRDMAVGQLDRLNGELGGLTGAEGLVGDLSGGLDQASGALDEIAGRVEAIQLPEIPEPEASDFGDNALADLAEGVVDAGLQQARALVQRVRQQLQQLIDGFKQQAAAKLQEVRVALDEVREFFVAYQERLAQNIGHVQETIQAITEKLAGCESFEDYIHAIIEQIGEVLGFEGLSVEGLRERWDAAGGYIDEALAAVEERIRECEAAEAGEAAAGGEGFVG